MATRISRRTWVGVSLLVIVSSLDYVFTHTLLWAGTVLSVPVHEINPLANGLLLRFGLPGMLVFKLVLLAFAAASVVWIASRQEKLATRCLRFGVYAYSAVCLYQLVLLHLVTGA